MARSRNFCFTLNNYTAEEVEAVKVWECAYLIFGKEVGESGTPHLQGYVSFPNAKTLAALKKYSARAHWEIARGTPKQASEYCEKDGDVFETGTRPLSPAEKGDKEKKRWDEAFVAVQENRLEDIPNDIKCVHLRSIEYAVKRQRIAKRNLETIDGPLEHQWIVGKTGCGKSRRAQAENPGAFIKDPTTQWWDGYNGEDVVIIDDFDKFQVKQGGDMKRWLDRYPFQAQFKGAYEMIRPKKIIVTSQYHPNEIWDDEKTVDAIRRRVTVVDMDNRVIFPSPPLAAVPAGPPAAAGALGSWQPRLQTNQPRQIASSHGSAEGALGGSHDPPSPDRFGQYREG